jgi:hypothetical protein
VLDQDGHEVDAGDQGDTLSASVHGTTTLVELADRHGSRLRDVPEQPELSDVLQKLEDAESPVFSADGAWMAYLHEEKGRGSLWVMHMQGRQDSAATLLELVSRTRDVRGMTFLPYGDLVFAATVDGRLGLYSMPPNRSREMEPFLVGDGPTNAPTDAPAVSPDGRWIAFRTLVNHRWQLAAMELATHRRKLLTAGDCDAYAPAWLDRSTILYATDCGRAVGLTALAKVRVDIPQP